MSFQITTAFVQQYKDNVMMLVQQKGSRLRGTVMEEPVTGRFAYFEQIGSVDARTVTERHADSPLISTPHARRRVELQDFDWGDLIDKPDKVRTLVDFTSPYVQNAGWAMGRSIDSTIINAFFANAFSGETGATTVAFPSAATNTIAVNFSSAANVGLTVEKLREARRLLRAGNVDVTEQLYIGVTARQIDNLLGSTQVTSSDYNSVKSLVQGDIDTFLGFKFIHTELLGVDGSSFRRVPAWSKSGMALGVGMDVVSRVTERSDKRFSTYVYFCMSIGATRLEEARVMEIKCNEA